MEPRKIEKNKNYLTNKPVLNNEKLDKNKIQLTNKPVINNVKLDIITLNKLNI